MNRRDLFKAAAGAAAACVLPAVKVNSYLATAKNTPPSRVYDALGNEIKKVISVHAGTGVAEVYVTDAQGKIQLHPDGSPRAWTKRICLAMPVRLVQVNA